MTGFDLLVLLIVGIAAVGGFMRGLVQEIFSLAAWVLAAFAVRYLHTPLTLAMQKMVGTDITTSLLAFALLLLIPYAAMIVIANNVSPASKNSILGPIDRVLGFGFGALKGVLITVLAFSLLVLGYDTVWSYKGRPAWMTTGRSYELIDSSSRSLVEVLAERHVRLRSQSSAAEE